jgi:hypothetical protein
MTDMGLPNFATIVKYYLNNALANQWGHQEAQRI